MLSFFATCIFTFALKISSQSTVTGLRHCAEGCLAFCVQIARVLSGFFLIIQIVLLLGFIYAINEFLIEKEEIGHRVALIGATVSMYAVGLVIIGFMYHYYAPFASCGLNIFFITWTLIMGIAYSLFSVRPVSL